jgi:hypothetical protein
MRRSLLLAALLAAAAAGCAGPGAQAANGPAPALRPSEDAAKDVVSMPDVKGRQMRAAELAIAEARLVAIVRYAPEVLADHGAVLLTEPKAGAALPAGDVVVLVVAGAPAAPAGFAGHPGAQALAQLAEGRSDVFVGAGWQHGDPAGPFVIALGPGVDQAAWESRIAAAAGAQKYLVRQCEHSLDQLSSAQSGLQEARSGLPAFSSAIDPTRCAVVVNGAFTTAQAERIKQTWGTAVALEAVR